MKCPCENCIILAVCRHKPYYRLFQECSLIEEYAPLWNTRVKRDPKQIKEIHDILNTTSWEILDQHPHQPYVWCGVDKGDITID